MKPRICNVKECPLHGGRLLPGIDGVINKVSKPVWGCGSSSPICMLIGEAPGGDEESYGRPFVGKSGQELTMYLKQFTRVSRERCYITNLVKCRPPKNRDPHVDEIACCYKNYLHDEIDRMRPSVIGMVGRVMTHKFLIDKPPMEKVHGIPQGGYWGGDYRFIAIPLYHPAYGLHSPRQMKDVIEDFTALGRVIRGQLKPRGLDEVELDYRLEKG